MSDRLDSAPLPEGRSIPAEDWQQPPLSVRLMMLTLLKRLAALESRLNRDSANASRPPSTDSPAAKRKRRMKATPRRKPGAQLGHPGHQQGLMEPTSTIPLWPEACSCGQTELSELTLAHTHPGIEWPRIRPEITHWLLSQGRCLSGGQLCTATVPADHASGYGPRRTGFGGERAGGIGASRSAVQTLCASVFSIPLSKGASQKLVDRVSEAIVPYYNASGEVARASLVNYSDETSWLMHGDRYWLWVMANSLVASFQPSPPRSKAAFAQLIADWRGILVRDGYLV